MTHDQSKLRETAILFANRIGSPWGEGATYDRSRTEPEDPEDIDEDDRKPNGRLYSHLSDEDFDLFVADFVAYITANYTPNTELKELVEASEKLNLALHGRPDCKSCSLQERLAVLSEKGDGYE